MNRRMIAFGAVVIGSLALGFSDTAQAQTVTLSQGGTPLTNNTITFTNVSIGTVSPSQAIHVTTNSDPNTIITSVSNASPWITVQQTQLSSPLDLQISVNATGLQVGTHQGAFTVQINGIPSSAQTVTVNATVTSQSSILSANPTSLSFTANQGATAAVPNTQTVQITTTNSAQLEYTVTAASTQNWLQVLTTCTTASPCATGGGGFVVQALPGSLTPSSTPYQGTITVQSTTTSDYITILVTLTISANATLTVSPTTLTPFLYQLGGQLLPASQQLSISSSGGPEQFTVSVTGALQNYLQVNPNQGQTGTQAVTVSISPINYTALPAGSYGGTITVTAVGGSALAGIGVSLVVTNNPLLTLTNSSASFTAQFGSTTSQTQQLTLSTTGGTVSFTASNDPAATWLAVSPLSGTASSTSPATLTLAANASSLAVGTYTGTIMVRPQTGDNYALPITVSLTVSSAAQLTAGPPLLHFSWQTSQSLPGPQLVQINSLGQPQQFNVTVPSTNVTTNCPANWLSASTPQSPATTTATITVSVNTTGMQAGTCSGTVVVTPTASGGQALNIPVTIDVSPSAELNVSFPLGFGQLTVPQNTTQTYQYALQLTSTATPFSQVTFTASATSSGNWLSVTPSASNTSTPTTLTVFVFPSGLPQGSYNGTITIFSSSLASGTITIPYSLTVTPNVTVTVNPSGTIALMQAQGGPAPQPQTVTLTATGGSATYTATVTPVTGGNWLQVNSGSTATGGVSPTANLALSVNSAVGNALPSSTTPYQASVTVSFGSSASTPTLTIPVTLLVNAAQTLTVSPSTLSFAYQLGTLAPTAQTVNVSSSTGGVAFTVGTTSAGWLSASPTSGSTPTSGSAAITVSVDPTKIPSGTQAGAQLTGTVSVSAPSISSTPTTVNVTLNITAAAAPTPVAIVNSASGAPGILAPGELITIVGAGLGPAAGTVFTVNNGQVASTLAGVQVLFDSTPGTPTYVSATQINVIVPFEVAGRATTSVSVVYNGAQSAPFTYFVGTSAPGLYTLTATGSGQAAALNQDYSLNGPSTGVQVSGTTIATKPASQGSIISIYGTGGGQTNPPSATGSVTSTTTLYPLAGWTFGSSSVTATIGGQPATVYFAGGAPGDVAGVVQFNLQVPQGVTGGALPVVITVNGVKTWGSPTVAVQ